MSSHLGQRKYDSIDDDEDKLVSIVSKRAKNEDYTSDELSEESDDRLQKMANAFRTIIEVNMTYTMYYDISDHYFLSSAWVKIRIVKVLNELQ
jgi:hypothetical protein